MQYNQNLVKEGQERERGHERARNDSNTRASYTERIQRVHCIDTIDVEQVVEERRHKYPQSLTMRACALLHCIIYTVYYIHTKICSQVPNDSYCFSVIRQRHVLWHVRKNERRMKRGTLPTQKNIPYNFIDMKSYFVSLLVLLTKINTNKYGNSFDNKKLCK